MRPRTVRVEVVGPSGPRVFSAVVRDVPPLPEAERQEQRRRLGQQVGGAPLRPGRGACGGQAGASLEPIGSFLLRGRRYDAWRQVEVLDGSRPGAVPLVTFASHVQAGDCSYDRVEPGPPFSVPGLEALAPARAAERLAVVDSHGYDERQAQLERYRRRAAGPEAAARLYELALMVWYQHFVGAPGPIGEAEPPLRRALELNPRSAAGHGLLGEVLLRGGRAREALSAFLEAARLLPRHPRYHYCASVAHGLAGDAAAASEALARAKRVAGPKLKKRFTSGSNPLEDFRYALLCEAGRLRERHEGLVRLSRREMAEADRAQNRIRPSRVPPALRPLIPLALKWGIGDDGSRAYLLRRATRRDKQQLRRAYERYSQRISDWLDSQLPAQPTDETGCFLYLLEACEELL